MGHTVASRGLRCTVLRLIEDKELLKLVEAKLEIELSDINWNKQRNYNKCTLYEGMEIISYCIDLIQDKELWKLVNTKLEIELSEINWNKERNYNKCTLYEGMEIILYCIVLYCIASYSGQRVLKASTDKIRKATIRDKLKQKAKLQQIYPIWRNGNYIVLYCVASWKFYS